MRINKIVCDKCDTDKGVHLLKLVVISTSNQKTIKSRNFGDYCLKCANEEYPILKGEGKRGRKPKHK